MIIKQARRHGSLFWITLLFIGFLSSIPAFAYNVKLAWDPNSDANLAGYYLYYGASSRNYTHRIDTGNATVYSVSGLGAGKYYFAVTAYGTSGAESPYSNEVALATGVTVVPITSAKAALLTGNAALVTWSTDLASDSQVQYGKTIAYGNASPLDGTLTTSHSQILSGLTPSTLYHFRAKSRAASGTLAISGDITFVTLSTLDKTPPSISGISSSVTGTTATISWTTNEPTNSQVDYGISSSYGLSTMLDTALVTAHSQTVSGLSVNSVIHWRVKSRDLAGNPAVSAEFTLQTTSLLGGVELSLFFPVVLIAPNNPQSGPGEEFTAVAVSNPDTAAATARFTLYDASGAEMRGDGIMNPVERTLPPGGQVPAIDFQLFGPSIYSRRSPGWVRVDSSTAKLGGFFLTFDSGLSFMDGADVSSAALVDHVLPEVGVLGGTKVMLANPGGGSALATIELVKADGTVRGTVQRFISANGSLSADLYGELFPGVGVTGSDYVRVSASQSLMSYEWWRKGGREIGMLTGQDRSGGAMTLYSPQYVVGGGMRSTLSIVNLDSVGGVVTLRMVGDNGVQIGATRVVNVAAGGKAYITDQAFFDSTVITNPGQLRSGYVEVTGANVRLTGSVVFGDARGSKYLTALPLVSTLRKSVSFSHIASNETSFTGVAVLNPGDVGATVAIELFDSGGKLTGSTTQVIAAGQRSSRLLTEYFPGLVAKDGTPAYFKVTADREVACFALFGSNSLSVLSAIPAQPVP